MLGDIRLEHLKGNSVRIRNSARYCEFHKILSITTATVTMMGRPLKMEQVRKPA